MKKFCQMLVVLVFLASSNFFVCVHAQTSLPVCERESVVTAAEYCLFLNQNAVNDPNHLYDDAMGNDPEAACIARLGAPGSWHYEMIAGRENFPICYVSDFDERAYGNETSGVIFEEDANDEISLKSNQCGLNVVPSMTIRLSLAETSPSNTSSQSFNPYLKDILGVATFFALGGYGLAGMMQEGWAPAQMGSETEMTSEQRGMILQQLRAAAVHPDFEGAENLRIRKEGAGITISVATTQSKSKNLKTLRYLEESLQAEHLPDIARSFISREIGSSSDELSTRLSTEKLQRILTTADEVRSAREAICSSAEAFNKKINLAEQTSSEWSLLRGRALNTLDESERIAGSSTLPLSKQKGKFLSEILTKSSDHGAASLSPISIPEAIDLLSRSKEQALYWENEKKEAEGILEGVGGDKNKALHVAQMGDEVLRSISDAQELLKKIVPKEVEEDPLEGKMSGLSVKDSFASAQTPLQQIRRIDGIPSSSFLSLEADADLFLKKAESVTARSKEAYETARNAIFQNQIEEGFRYYERAIDLAKKAAAAWIETEQAYLQLVAQPGKGGIRIYGQRLKTTWAENAKTWKSEFEKLGRRLDKIEKKTRGVSESEAIRSLSAWKLSELELHADSLRTGAKSLEAEANNMYESAQSRERTKDYSFALPLYEEAIFLANKTASAWRETEQAHIQLAQISEKKIRQWGKQLKGTWASNARIWSSEMVQCAQKLEKVERGIRVKEMVEKSLEARASNVEALKHRDAQDQIERNEIGNVYDIIARHYGALVGHYQEAAKACSEKNNQAVEDLIAKTTSIKGTITALETHLEDLLSAKKKWDEEDPATRCLENDEENHRSVFKARFIGPLVRREEVINVTGVSHTVEMAAEHLMVTLKKGETEESFLQQLSEPESRLELVSSSTALYRLYFKSNPERPFPWLQSMDAIREKIENNSLAARCYPDYLMEIDSSNTPTQQTGQPGVSEPWALNDPQGVSLPSNFSTLAPPAGRPIRVAIIDTGINDTHQAFTDKILRGNHGVGSYGHDVTAFNPLAQGYPRDDCGHGTHVAGIVAAAPQQVKKLKAINPNTKIIEEQTIPEATITGLAGMPRMVELIVCKWVQPGLIKGFCSKAIECIEYAKTQGALILNCSWHRRLHDLNHVNPNHKIGFTEQEARSLEDAMRDKRFVFVASAGNEGIDIDQQNIYPSTFVLRNLVTVAATNKNGKLASVFSNFGSNHVHITAPGKDIISTWHVDNDAYNYRSGTSMAAPYVSAALAHIKVKFPQFDAVQLVQHLLNRVNVTKKTDLKVKYGALDLAKALKPLPVEEVPRSPVKKKNVVKIKVK